MFGSAVAALAGYPRRLFAPVPGLWLESALPIRLCLLLALWLPVSALAADPPAATANTLAAIRARHHLACGVVAEAHDWNKDDLHGNLSPLGREICSAIAVAVLGRAEAAGIIQLPAEPEALHALQAGQVDVVAGLTPSISVAQRFGVAFGPVLFWDSQTFMVHRSLDVADAAGLSGKPVCYIDGTDNDTVLRTAMAARGIGIIPFPFQEEGEMDAGLIGGRCRAISAYASKLAEARSEFHAMVHDFVLLPDRLALSPLAIATRQADPAWSAVAAATVDVLVEAAMLGIGRANIAHARTSDDPVVQHLLGINWSAGQSLGLARDWSARVIAAMGNYTDIYRRSVGEQSALGLAPGLNADCLHGGLICAAPLR